MQLTDNSDIRHCEVCGCTNDSACMTSAGPCHWVGASLCSACAYELLKDPANSRSTFVLLPDDIEALRQRIRIEIDGESALDLIATIQLACRHPKFDCATRDFVERFARDLQQEIARTRRLALLLEAGWHSRFDTSNLAFVTRTGGSKRES